MKGTGVRCLMKSKTTKSDLRELSSTERALLGHLGFKLPDRTIFLDTGDITLYVYNQPYYEIISFSPGRKWEYYEKLNPSEGRRICTYSYDVDNHIFRFAFCDKNDNNNMRVCTINGDDLEELLGDKFDNQ